MSSYRVVFTPEAEEHLAELYQYISDRSTPDAAFRFTMAIVSYSAALDEFPHRGVRRDDIRPGLRIVNYRKNTAIAIAVDDADSCVTIVGVFYGGRNYEALLRPKDNDEA
ncbi:type II toxin-antitoxin system RelE/ParE family toxin [Massilia soli]|uniref:Type II toxin-antitoxin system RelE/ParE family toxin n=1 Tax=Massilia soli TaxID=2792854 RepID=A0ABS7SL00_9BURK|nr:type II toxin-antitoxin system RelE/ParE family toxin [Massilia soli]MBZ2206476.1 type II toxin-antitoxin system RelE/ParE family toxin [Massilia soli]